MELEQEPGGSLFDSLVALFEGRRGNILVLLLLPLLLLLVLWLPPISLVDRIMNRGYDLVYENGGMLAVEDGTQLTIRKDALERPTYVRLSKVSREAFIEGTTEEPLQDAAAALPRHLSLRSPVYLADARDPRPRYTVWSMSLPPDAEPDHLLDLYAWDGNRWSWLPYNRIEGEQRIEASAAGVPAAVAAMKAQRSSAQVGATTNEEATFINQAAPTLSYLSPRLYLVQGDGNIGQLFSLSPLFTQSGVPLVPVLHNIEGPGVVRSDLVDNLLIDRNAWMGHIDRIEQLVLGRGYEGITIDYRNVDPALRGKFSEFIVTLGQRLSKHNKMLNVRVDRAVRVAEDDFDTRAYDWQTIGQVASNVILPMAPAPEGTEVTEEMRALFHYATSRINRYKIRFEMRVAPYRMTDGQVHPLSYQQLLPELATLAGREEAALATLEEEADALMTELVEAGEAEWDPSTGSYRLSVRDNTVYVENAETITQKLTVLDEFHIAGVTVVDARHADSQIWPLLERFLRGPVSGATP